MEQRTRSDPHFDVNMNTTRSLEQRKRFSLLMTIGALLFVAALVYIRLQESKPWPAEPRHLIIFLIPALVYLVCRYARTDFVVALFALGLLVLSPEIVWPQYEVPDPFLFLLPVVAYLVCRYARTDIAVKLLALGLLVLSAAIVVTPHGMSDEFMWIKVAAVGLCGVGLLMGVRWAAYLWCVLAVAVLIDVVSIGPWNLDAGRQYGMLSLLAMVGLLFLIFGVGGSVAIACETNATRSGRLSSMLVEPQASRWFIALCAVVALLVAVQWFATLIPAPVGFEQLHPSLKPIVGPSSSHEEPSCSAITYCGPYVELTCHPERDGPVDYYNNTNGELIMHCGGGCMNGPGPPESKMCSVCPPPEWSRCTAPAASAPR
jgi:hypothetical protein